jgi:hypothetical protein
MLRQNIEVSVIISPLDEESWNVIEDLSGLTGAASK